MRADGRCLDEVAPDRHQQREVGGRCEQREEQLEEPHIGHAHQAERARRPVAHGPAMLPGALQRAEAPAEALLEQRTKRLRRLRPGNRAIGQADAIPLAEKREGEVLVFGQCVVPEAPARQDRVAPPGTDRARHHRDAVEQRERATVEVLARDVLDRLPPRDEVD
ncbi:MAG: hypothetical protein MUE41_08385, partial [Gemmatimonadaceae bacterium]|nr:hypothetical protein [Gemmatimonadaceae bacterium]